MTQATTYLPHLNENQLSSKSLKEGGLKGAPCSTKSPPGQKAAVSPVVFATLIIVFTEVMFFVALISAFLVIKGANPNFAVPAGITLPKVATGFNTGVLFASGALLYLAWFKRATWSSAVIRAYVLRAALFGAFFVTVQGFEWVRLMGFGLRMGSSIFGACFFLLIGAHAVHAVLGILVLLRVWWLAKSGLASEHLAAALVFWSFIVGIWPFLYGLVYF